ncbi:hypothetical protein B7486_63730, partial [cyanobacterium TDX16]
FELVAEPESFLVDSDTHLVAGEEDRAVAWGRGLLDGMAGLAREEAGTGASDDAAIEDLDASLTSGGRYAPPT